VHEPVLEDNMSVFIFQSIQERFDLRTSLVPGKRDTWLASRYRGEMHSETAVFFWMAGDEQIRGAYGWGLIASEPYLKPEWKNYAVDVIYQVKFSQPLLASILRSDRILANMLIFRAPQATNFLLSEEEAARLVDLVEARGDRAPAADTLPSTTQTLGELVALALSIGAQSLVDGLAGEAIRDAYNELKERAATWVGGDIEALEKNPASVARQVVISEEIDRQSPDDLVYLRGLAVALVEALQATIGFGSIGLDAKRLKTAQAQIGLINMNAGVGVRAKNIQAGRDFVVGSVISDTGNVVIGAVKSGVAPVDPWPEPRESKK
jgi:hypothetical protein